jgi:hypothetical protein
MTVEALAINCFEYFCRSIRDPMDEYMRRHDIPPSDFPLPRMSVAVFEKHIRKHTLNPMLIFGEDVRELMQLQEIVKNNVKRRATDEVDHKAIDSYTKLLKAKHMIMTTPADRLLFKTNTGESLDLDPNKMGRLGNLLRVESLLINTANTIGGQMAADTSANTGDNLRMNFTVEDADAADSADIALINKTLNDFTTPAVDAMDIDSV